LVAPSLLLALILYWEWTLLVHPTPKNQVVPMCSPYIPISNLLFQSTFNLLLSILQIKLFLVLCENWSLKLSQTWRHTLLFLFLKIWHCGLLCWVVMLASCKLEISPAMPSWGKLSTLHFLFELLSWSFVYGYSRCEIIWESCGIMEFVYVLEKCLGR
jgi:hypothetical protein